MAELTTDDLRFDVDETAKLFNETYGRNLDPDVLVDLAERTEGWIASLHLVQAALRDRSPGEIRRFVKTLNGADKEMYDYLAEEVVGELSLELQRFLMDTSILQVVTPDLAEVVSGHDAVDVARLVVAAERVTLLSRLSGAPRTHQRYHPLVREFLEARFRSLDGDDAVNALHRRTAAATSDWRIAAHHYREAGDTEQMLAAVSRAIPEIMGNGQYALAEAFIDPVPPDERPTGFGLITSRVEMQQGDYEAAMAASQAVLDSATNDIERDYALLNLITLNYNSGNGEATVEHATALRSSGDSGLRSIADATVEMILTGEGASLDKLSRRLQGMAKAQGAARPHFFAITQHNLAVTRLLQNEVGRSLVDIQAAIDALEAGSAVMELRAARMVKASVLATMGRLDDATNIVEGLLDETAGHDLTESSIESADLFDTFLDPSRSWSLIAQARQRESISVADRRSLCLVMARWFIRRREFGNARSALEAMPSGRPTAVAFSSQLLICRAYLAVAAGLDGGSDLALEAEAACQSQGAQRLRRVASLLVARTGTPDAWSRGVSANGREAPHSLAYVAELVATRLAELDELSLEVVRQSAVAFPSRWRLALRDAVEISQNGHQLQAAKLLEEVGDRSDVRRLRAIARQSKRRPDLAHLGRSLARRVADRVVIEDQGRVSLLIGQRVVPGSEIRRKVLALVCYLVTRPGMSSTRDQVLEALWPDLAPDVAINSLNQTIYFLRRVFEPDYSEDLSPGYVHHDSDVVWLDPELIACRSRAAKDFIRSLPARPSPDEVERLVGLYLARFALDFEYEEWAGSYRDNLHAAYLEIVERAVVDDFATGHHDRGISVARRALEVDPTAEQIEVSLLRLYKATGAHAAAAEQYAHYASAMRDDLGLEVPPLDAI
ncbi:MAG: BTAD domain-containing putative transcriptional regulator [Candidatus Limnocylindrales bacterium]